jgi:hypothetical protein
MYNKASVIWLVNLYSNTCIVVEHIAVATPADYCIMLALIIQLCRSLNHNQFYIISHLKTDLPTVPTACHFLRTAHFTVSHYKNITRDFSLEFAI